MMRLNLFSKAVLSFWLILLGLAGSAQSYNVNLNLTPEQMVQNLVGEGVQISNVVVTACDSTYGYYTSTGTELGNNQGLLLTTGKALYSVGPNNSIGNCSTSAGTCDFFDNDCPGSPLLNLAQDRTTYDATMIEFDIIPQGDSLKFKYTFASEEYNEWVNSPFNDVFGFFITGPNVGTDVNLALIPNSSQVVAINTVNPLSNSQYFYNNQNPLGQFIQYDGFTIGLQAKVGNLIPCESYHLKLVIADGTDRVYDSGVFINAIESNPVAVLTATSNGLDYMVEGCNTGTVTFAREEITQDSQEIIYWIGGTATNGIDYSPQIGTGFPGDINTITIPANEQTVSFEIEALLDNFEEGEEYITIYLGNPLCTGNQVLDSINFFIYDRLEIEVTPADTGICVGQCVELQASSSLLEIGDFTWSGDVNNPDSLTVEVCPEETTTYEITVTVGNCSASAEATVSVSSITLVLNPTDANCEGGNTGSMSATVIDGLEPYTYSWSGPEEFTSDAAVIEDLEPGIYCLDIIDATGCTASACDTIIQINELNATSLLSDFTCNQISCAGSCDGTIEITVSGGVGPFEFAWSGPDSYTGDTEDIANLCAGTYDLVLTDSVGCEYTNSYTLTEPDSVQLLVVGSTDLLCTGVETGEASVATSGGCSPYTYTWSHDVTVTGPVATDLGSGTYEVSVQDQNGCTSEGSVTILINEPIDPLNVIIDEISVYPGGFSVSCPGAEDGFINITVSGGVLDYFIEWFSVTENTIVSTSEDLTEVACGEYQLTVTDGNGCVYTQSLQLTCVPAITVEYEVVNNPCGDPNVGQGSVDVTNVSGGQGGPYTFLWNGPSCSPCNTDDITNLNSGDYVLIVTDTLGCQTSITANIGQNDAFEVVGTITNPSCSGVCDGAINLDITDGSGGGGGGGADFLVNSETQIQVCVTGNHTWVSDLTFLMQGPPSCGSPEILLNLHPFGVGQAANCNSGNDFTNLCFSTESSNNLNVCSAGAPLTGTFGTYSDLAIPIDWSAFNGCDVNEAGWTVKVQDCVLTDFGTLTAANITFTGTDTQNNAQSVTYMTPGGFSSAITNPLVQGCDPNVLAQFVVDESMVNNDGGGGNNGNYSFIWTGPFTGPAPTTEDISGLCGGTYTVQIISGDCEETLVFDLIEPEALEITLVASINPTCFGQNNGSIDIDVTGGSGDYSYSWAQDLSCPFFGATSQDISNLAECVYTVTVTDNVTGCTGQFTTELIAPQVMELVVVTSQFDGGYNISCNGENDGAISVFVTGGTPDCNLFAPHCYNYDWITDCSEVDPELFGNDPNAPNATNLPGGAYGINVTDSNGCLATTCLDLSEPDTISSPAIIDNIDCNNITGCITPALTGGSNFYITYEWTGDIGANSPSASTLCGLEAGTYTLTVTDSNGCQDTFEYEIETTPILEATLESATGASCFGLCDGTATIIFTGGEPPLTGTLNSPDFETSVDVSSSIGEGSVILNDLCGGLYSIDLEDANGCTAEVSFNISEPDSISIDLTSIIQEDGQIFDLQCVGDDNGAVDASVNGGVGGYSFEWFDEGNNVIGTDEDITGLTAGIYCLTVIDENLCESTQCIELFEPDSLLEASGVVSIYNEVYNISCYNETDGSIDITVAGGVAPYTFSWQGEGTIEEQEDQTGLGAGTYDVLIVDANFCQLTLSFTLVEPTPIQVESDVSNVSCFDVCDGEIEITVSGGAGPYEYAWAGPDAFNSTDEDLSDLCAGEYFLTVSDSIGCSETFVITVTEPALLEVSIDPQVNCATGEVTLCAIGTGGTPQYSYEWSTGESTSCIEIGEDGEYCVTITDVNGCSATVCADANASSPIDVAGTITQASCGQCDGAIDITIAGGQTPYDIAWSNSAGTEDLNNLCAGAYTITVTDANDCSVTETFTINESTAVDINLSTVNVSCFGDATGSASVTATGGSGNYTYSWINENEDEIGTGTSVGQLTAGSYSVTVTDGECSATETFSIGQSSGLELDYVLSQYGEYNVSGSGASDGSIFVVVSGGTPDYVYNWSPISVADTTTNPQNLAAGDYTLSVVDANGCKIDTVITLIGQEDIKLYTALSPNGDLFNDTYVIDGVINCGSNIFKVFNRWGNLVYEVKNYANQWYGQNDDNETLADGTYFVIFEGCGVKVSTYVDLRRN